MAIRTIIVGYGRSAEALHAPAIEQLKDFAVTGALDLSGEARARARERFGCETYAEYEKALDAPADLAVILTRNDQHAKMAEDFLRRGKHVLVTKPWALYEAEALRMMAARGDKLLLPWLPCRFASDLRALQRVARSGEIGKLFMVRRQAASFGRRADWQTEKRCGGGYLLNWGPHLVDQALLLLGGEVESVWGETRRVINPGDAEDSFFLAAKMSGGRTAVAEYAIAAPGCLPDWIAQGDGGSAWIQNGVLTVTTARQPDAIDPRAYRDAVSFSTRTEKIDEAALYGDAAEIYAQIARAIRGEERYAVSCEDALRLTRVLDAAYKSAACGEAVRL